MIIKLFDIQNDEIIPSEHCYALEFLKVLMSAYPESYMQIYKYLFYMTCPNPDYNPFFHLPEQDKEEIIIEEVGLEESVDCLLYTSPSPRDRTRSRMPSSA